MTRLIDPVMTSDFEQRRSAARRTALGLFVVAALVYATYIVLTVMAHP